MISVKCFTCPSVDNLLYFIHNSKDKRIPRTTEITAEFRRPVVRQMAFQDLVPDRSEARNIFKSLPPKTFFIHVFTLLL